ncbi:MAG TPA: M48 family metallopeptidase, partial [Gemmatimonadaceae bacterium]|nr:M48 family metallopeptidase [Gemmatimonadaceae bacterium]
PMKRLLAALAAAATLSGCAISTQQEVQMGQQYSQQINAQLPIIKDPEVNRYINVLGDSIARLADSRDLDWKFYIVDAPDVNAFALPGGIIYVNRGLIERSAQMDELAGALGHEIGHVVRRHVVRDMQRSQGANIGVIAMCVLLNTCNDPLTQNAINIAGGAVFAKFSRADEAEADAEGVKNVVRAGIDPRGLPDLFRVLLDERKTKPAGVDAWFLSHPLEEDRITHTNALIAQIDPAILATLTKDSPNYQAFRKRLASLPHAPQSRQQQVP